PRNGGNTVNSEELLKKRLARLKKWVDRSQQLVESRLKEVETLFTESIKALEEDRSKTLESFTQQGEALKGQLELLGKDYTQKKYLLERDTTLARGDNLRNEEEFHTAQKQLEKELNRLNEEKVNVQVSFERQNSALTELYGEQRRHILVEREKLLQQWNESGGQLNAARLNSMQELEKLKQEQEQHLNVLRDQVEAKKQGWQLAIETMRRDYEAMAKEKASLEERLANIRAEKEKEVEEARVQLQVAKEQLEVNKATLIEKAEEDRRTCELEVKELKDKVEAAEKELQDLVIAQTQKKKDSEEAFQKEESLLKETVQSETEKRDYEQKLFQQEKAGKEKELGRLREEYEKKKWHWENQLRTLMMQKSVQESEHDAERMRVDREARAAFRTLEAKRDELKQRLAEIKSRQNSLQGNAEKEKDLLNQRWQWRKDRLWSMWQNRLEVLRKERELLAEQLEGVETYFLQQQNLVIEQERREIKRTEDLEQYMSQMAERHLGQKKQKEIQIELEKTRLFAQIKECEGLIGDWMERLRLTQQETGRKAAVYGDQMNFLDALYQEEEKQTELFLYSLQKAMAALQGALPEIDRKRNAA
ncbi:MAG: hypothetical protein LHV69_09900, partial [Elusimicrobia bacterium]|nr:hypothetical protein [Candidatus Obscuribacterium magneticum]